MTTNTNATTEKALAEYNAYIEAKYGKIPTITEYFAQTEITEKNTKATENLLIPADAFINSTYNGKTGCACGCGGDYTEKGENTNKAKSRINKINKFFAQKPTSVTVYDFSDEMLYEITTSVGEEFDRVTRVYVAKVGA
jgi:hypothetical protein